MCFMTGLCLMSLHPHLELNSRFPFFPYIIFCNSFVLVFHCLLSFKDYKEQFSEFSSS